MEQIRINLCVVAAALSLSACTETVYQPFPVTNTAVTDTPVTESPATEATATPSTGAQNDPISSTSVPGNATAATVTANNTSNSTTDESPTTLSNTVVSSNTSTATTALDETSQVNALVANAVSLSTDTIHAPAVIGEPGAIVDCDLLLPCRWVSASEDLTLTMGNVDNTGTLGRLSIQYTVNASYDTELLLGNGSTALAAGGESYSLIQQSLGTGNGITPLAALAGEQVTGSATYDREASSNTLAGLTLTIVDNGLPRTVGFINLPVGTPNNVAVNCANVLPCEWESTQGDVSINLVAVGGHTANGRLNVNFNAVSQRDMDIVLDAGATAIGVSGEQYEGRTHSLGVETGFAEVKTTAPSGVMISGNVSFFRTAQTPNGLKSLDLVIFEDAPISRWNPQFINIPTQ